MENSQKKIQLRLMTFFWINILSVVFIFLALLYSKGPNIGESAGTNVTFERYAIVFTMIGIPLALKFFHSQHEKIRLLSLEQYLGKYMLIYSIRMAILDAVIVLNMIGLYLFESQNCIYMTVITIFALMFCYPNKNSLLIKESEQEPLIETEENKNNE
ncbi:hypothetical protein [Dysgonomonas sp. ZJ279]|uniref:hypothetical protein n=1 Tax=Dysgonomonas sp. ZJ279 TaxID=2709796 RepID=UPI0013EDF677|nr:hypothetical protein [Dysgonomonas sp. ZJ279]